jgi:N-formylglutamate deformylase
VTPVYALRRGGSPLILSIPHAGRDLMPGLAERLTPAGRSLIDTDWWLEQLYGFAGEDLDATVLTANYSRYVIDLNRDPSGASLYPGQPTTELSPTTTFDSDALYTTGRDLRPDEISDRRTNFFAPYHAALADNLTRIKAAHGYALLYDCHSIRSIVPRLFSGTLPVFNLGTNSGASCAVTLEAAIADVIGSAKGYTHIINGRFKGGWITRHYGQPADGVHAVQMELACRAYMDEAPPFPYDMAKAARVTAVLREILETMLTWGQTQRGSTP